MASQNPVGIEAPGVDRPQTLRVLEVRRGQARATPPMPDPASEPPLDPLAGTAEVADLRTLGRPLQPAPQNWL